MRHRCTDRCRRHRGVIPIKLTTVDDAVARSVARLLYRKVVGEHRDVGTLDASLLEMFPPRPSVRDVLDGNNPSRAIEYWENAIGILKSKPKDESRQPVIAYYGPTRDWGNDRPRKDWAGLWLDEPLDIRPAAEATQALSTIAKTARNEAEEESMRAIAERLGIALRTAYALVKDAGAMSVTHSELGPSAQRRPGHDRAGAFLTSSSVVVSSSSFSRTDVPVVVLEVQRPVVGRIEAHLAARSPAAAAAFVAARSA